MTIYHHSLLLEDIVGKYFLKLYISCVKIFCSPTHLLEDEQTFGVK